MTCDALQSTDTAPINTPMTHSGALAQSSHQHNHLVCIPLTAFLLIGVWGKLLTYVS